jgi:hypothetical protein
MGPYSSPRQHFCVSLFQFLALYFCLRVAVDVLDDITVPSPVYAPIGGSPPGAPGAARLHHLTVCTRREAGLTLLLESGARFGYSSTVLGLNDTRPLGHWATAFGLKLILMLEAVSALPPNDWVLFTDAYDVVFQRPAAELLAALEAWGAGPEGAGGRLLFTAEVYEWPDLQQPYDTRHLRLPYLNSGVYAGRAGDVRRAVSGGYDLNTDDQRFFTQQYFEGGRARHVLDHGAHFFASLAGLNPGEHYQLVPPTAAGGLPLLVPNPGSGVEGKPPFVLHFNGAFGKKHFFDTAGFVLGQRGALLSERAAWVHGLRYWLMLPFREAMILAIPWRARMAIRSAGLTDAVALALPAAAALALRWWWVKAHSCKAFKEETLIA